MRVVLRALVSSALLATVLTHPAAAATEHGTVDMTGTATVDCVCGPSHATMSGSYVATVDGVPHSGSFVSNFTTFEGGGGAITCMVAGTASGTIDFAGWGSVSFTWTRWASLVVMSFRTPEGYDATVYGQWYFVSPLGSPCGPPNVQATFAGTGLITTP